jgi:predicted nucleotidyltransferase
MTRHRAPRLRKSDSLLASLLSSPALARLVAHFVLHPDQALHFRALQRHTAVPNRSLQTALARLQVFGVVTRRPEGRHVTFQANSAAPLWNALREVVRNVADPTEVLRDALADVPGIDAAFVYGSTARGDTRPDSDVDLFVVGAPADESDLAVRTMEVSALLGREVNVSRYSRAALKERRHAGSPFLERVLAGSKRWVLGDSRRLSRLVA